MSGLSKRASSSSGAPSMSSARGTPTAGDPRAITRSPSMMRSSGEASRRSAAASTRRLRTASAAMATALPPSIVARLPNAPMPSGTTSVSPWLTVTAS